MRPRSPMAETEDLKSFQCRFESDRGHHPYVNYHAHLLNGFVYVMQWVNKCIQIWRSNLILDK